MSAVAAVLLILVASIAIMRGFDLLDRPGGQARHPESQMAARPAPPPPDPRLASVPARGDAAAAFTADDYPAEAQRRGEQGRTVTRLTLDAAGAPVRCVVATSSGSASLDAATCRVALERVRYSPARDQLGRPIASAITLPVRWVLPDQAPEQATERGEDGPPFWVPLMLAAVAAWEAFTTYRGWTTGRITAPRSFFTAVRATSPALFFTYLACHLLFAFGSGTGAIMLLFG